MSDEIDPSRLRELVRDFSRDSIRDATDLYDKRISAMSDGFAKVVTDTTSLRVLVEERITHIKDRVDGIISTSLRDVNGKSDRILIDIAALKHELLDRIAKLETNVQVLVEHVEGMEGTQAERHGEWIKIKDETRRHMTTALIGVVLWALGQVWWSYKSYAEIQERQANMAKTLSTITARRR